MVEEWLVLSVLGVTLPSGFTVAGVVCFVSVFDVVVRSVVGGVLLLLGCGLLLGATTVVGGVCSHPTSMNPRTTGPTNGINLVLKRIV